VNAVGSAQSPVRFDASRAFCVWGITPSVPSRARRPTTHPALMNQKGLEAKTASSPRPATHRGVLLANRIELPRPAYQPTVTVAIVGFSVCSEELKPPTSSYANPYDSALTLWSCQNFEYEFDGLA